MGTTILIPAYIMEQNNWDVLAITGFAHQILDNRGSVAYIEFTKDLSALEKTTMQSNIATKNVSSKIIT